MPVDVEARTPSVPVGRATGTRHVPGQPLLIGLVNNMPDTALHATETQFQGLLQAAAGGREIRLRLSSFPELPRCGEARERVERCYWALDELLAAPLDALIVTGTEPRASRLTDEPYWQRSVELLAFAEQHTAASVWSCLAAHSAVLHLRHRAAAPARKTLRSLRAQHPGRTPAARGRERADAHAALALERAFGG